MTEAAKWYVVMTNPRCEERAKASVKARGIGPYLPLEARQRVLHRRKFDVTRPLFPRYLFIAVDDPRQFYDLRSCDGVYGLLRTNTGEPLEVPPGQIAYLQAAETVGIFDYRPRPAFTPGEPVRVTAGAYKGIVADVVGMPSKRRVEILLQYLGAPMRVRLSVEELQHA